MLAWLALAAATALPLALCGAAIMRAVNRGGNVGYAMCAAAGCAMSVAMSIFSFGPFAPVAGAPIWEPTTVAWTFMLLRGALFGLVYRRLVPPVPVERPSDASARRIALAIRAPSDHQD